MIVIQTDASLNHPFFTDQTHLNIFMKINTHGMILGYHEDQTQTKQTKTGGLFSHSIVLKSSNPPFFGDLALPGWPWPNCRWAFQSAWGNAGYS